MPSPTRIGVDELFQVASKPGLWSHLMCDDFSTAGLAQLHRFAVEIGLPPRAFHNPAGRGRPRPHYDLRPDSRERALAHGAERLTRRDLVEWLERGRARGEAERALQQAAALEGHVHPAS